jgi:hypothetical protein
MGGIMRGRRMTAITSSLPGIWRRPKAQPAKMPMTVLTITAMAPMIKVFFMTSGMFPTSIAQRYQSHVSWGGSHSRPNQPFPTERRAIIRKGAVIRRVRQTHRV